MSLVPSEDQQILKRTADDFVRSKSSLKRIRALRDSDDPVGYSRDLWREMAALGWVGILVPEKHGGSGLGYVDLAMVMEELGRGLMPEPMISTALLGANAVLLGGTDRQKEEILPAVCRGDLTLALGYHEPDSRFDPRRVSARAERSGKEWRLGGEKHLVLDGHAADRIVVSARTAGASADAKGITLFLVDPQARGVSLVTQRLLDSRRAAIVRFDGVTVGPESVIGEVDEGGDLLEAVLDLATAGLCAEMLGSMLQAFDMTLEYLRTRTQFGVPIGSFQALKHRAANVFTETELARSAVLGVCRALDSNDGTAADLVDVAKARCADAFLLTANEAVQMHGGIGMTDEHDIGFFLKRARATEMIFGDAAWHRRRYAERRGY